MARPLKQTVDYFPHFCNGSKTLVILENHYGNDGYAFWFKLLEVLSKSNGHVYDCNNPAYWEFLLARTKVSEVIANEIIGILVNLGKLDAELWQNRVIWCQNLVNNLDEVYRRRQTPLPQKPSYCVQEHAITQVNVNSNPTSSIDNVNSKRQRRVEESIVENSRVEEKQPPISFENYVTTLKEEYKDLNVDTELQKFKEYWSEGKRKLKKPKYAFHNWLDKSRQFKQEHQTKGREQLYERVNHDTP
jgi:hypothetical protein